MPKADEDNELDAEVLARLEHVANTLGHLSTTSTVVPPAQFDEPPQVDRELRVVVGETLGEGGMAIVRLGEQRSLGRTVAVKTLRSDPPEQAEITGLLREALVTGVLEHPNIVPVYDIDEDRNAHPRIILKRIEGREWSDLIQAPPSSDALDWNLAVLLQVCQAVRFAHGRGILHRDIKPENVMIGEFGEVYLLDWGISVATSDDGTHRFALASEATSIAGTPAYMAPEMLDPRETAPTVQTDVYLLGATLFEVLVGRPPHTGGKMHEVLFSVARSQPELPDETPAELGAVVRRAMAGWPHERFDDVAEFVEAIEDFRTHRASRRLTERAAASEAAMLAALQAGELDLAHEHFAECRFGHRAALEAWSGNEPSSTALLRVTGAMIEAELERGDAEAAGRWLATVDAAPAELVERVHVAKSRAASKQRRIRALEADVDEGFGRRLRLTMSAVLAMIWTVGPVVSGYFVEGGVHSLRQLGVSAALVGVPLMLITWFGRHQLLRTRMNRTLLGLTILTVFSQVLLVVGAHLGGWEPRLMHQLYPLIWFVTVSAGALSLRVHAWPASFAMLAAFLVSARWPEARRWAMSGANFVLFLVVLWINRVGRDAAMPEE